MLKGKKLMGQVKAAPIQHQLIYPSKFMQWLSVAVLFLLYILSLTDRYLIALLVEPIKASTSLTDFQISLLQGPAFAVLYCICAIPVGLLLDRYSRRLTLFFCIIVWSFGAAGCGLAGTFVGLAIARSLVGAGEAGFSTGAYSIVGDSFPPHQVSFAMSIFVMGGVMGAGIVFLLGGPIVEAILHGAVNDWPFMAGFLPWQQTFIVIGLPGVLMAFLMFTFREPQRHKNPNAVNQGAGYGHALSFLMKNKRLYLAIFIGFGLVYTVTIALQLWLPSYFTRNFGWSPKQIGMYMGIAQISAALSLPVHGWIVDTMFKKGRHDAHLLWCIISMLLAAPCALTLLMVNNPWVSIIFFGLFMMFILSSASIGPASTQLVTPVELRGRVSAIYVMVTGLLAMSVGPTLVGWLTDSVLKDPKKVGVSLIITLIVMYVPTLVLFVLGREKMRNKLGSSEEANPA